MVANRKGGAMKVRLSVPDPEGGSHEFWIEREWDSAPRVGDKLMYHPDTTPGVVRDVLWTMQGSVAVMLQPGEVLLRDDHSPITDAATLAKVLRDTYWQKGPEGSGL
jgi:hypothetical protein